MSVDKSHRRSKQKLNMMEEDCSVFIERIFHFRSKYIGQILRYMLGTLSPKTVFLIEELNCLLSHFNH